MADQNRLGDKGKNVGKASNDDPTKEGDYSATDAQDSAANAKVDPAKSSEAGSSIPTLSQSTYNAIWDIAKMRALSGVMAGEDADTAHDNSHQLANTLAGFYKQDANDKEVEDSQKQPENKQK
jgi:hypothetical protein